MIHNHYEGRGRGLSDLLKPRNVSEAVKVRSKESCQSQGNCLKIGTFKKLVSRNLDKSREKAQIVSIVSELFLRRKRKKENS